MGGESDESKHDIQILAISPLEQAFFPGAPGKARALLFLCVRESAPGFVEAWKKHVASFWETRNPNSGEGAFTPMYTSMRLGGV